MAGTGFHCILRMDYGEHEHCFSDVQRWYKKKVDGIIMGGGNAVGARDLEAATRSIQGKDGDGSTQ